MDWQPIETAPVGVPCLVYMPAWESGGKKFPHNMTTAMAEYPGEYSWLLCEPGLRAEEKDVYPYPTHWMPLPDPPITPPEVK